MSKFVLVFWLMLPCICVYAQKENVWVFNRAGLDFNVNNAEPSALSTAMDTKEAAASVCDDNGNLLFYTEGSVVWDRNNQIMPNGLNLTPFANTFMTPTASTSQGAVIVPMIDSAHKYYIFSLLSNEWGADMGTLYYSVVDMTLNGGLGDVVVNEKAVYLNSGLIEKMVAIVGDECNIWLLTCSKEGKFHAFEITEDGINATPVISNVGMGNEVQSYGNIAVSPNRKKIAATAVKSNGAAIYDFNASTGLVSNELIIHNSAAYGVCFSPDNSKLYISGYGLQSSQTLQFDLSFNDPDSIIKSRVNLGGLQFVNLKAGPNGKIYFGSSNNRLGVIKYPNLAGTACEFTPNEVILPGNSDLTSSPGLPNSVPVLKKEVISTFNALDVRFQNSVFVQALNLSGQDYVWDDGESGAERTFTESGLYWVSYHIPPCTKQVDTFQVNFLCDLPVLHFKNSCRNAADGGAWVSLDTDNNVTEYYYIWRDQKEQILSHRDSLLSIEPGNYSVQITTNTGCDTTISFQIVSDDFRVSFKSDTLVCQNQEVYFENTSADYFQTFEWHLGDEVISSAQNANYKFPAAGNYNMVLIGHGQYCSDSALKTISVDPEIRDLYLTLDKREICQGEHISLSTVSDSTVKDFLWSFDGDAYLTTSGNSIQHAFDIAGKSNILLTIAFRACPEISYTDSILVHPLPKIDLGNDTSLCFQGNAIVLSNKWPYTEGDLYSWSTGASSREIKAIQSGTYGLKVTSAKGCSSTEKIEILKDCYIDIPNAFTPNGDGVNDYFFPKQFLSQKVSRFHMQVFNRWGKLVFETTSTNGRGWDGRFNNEDQPEGVYIYAIAVEFDGHRNEKYEGNVTLLR